MTFTQNYLHPRTNGGPQLAYRTIVQLDKQNLQVEQEKLHLTPGMQVAAEIKLADQTVMQYLLSPVTKAFHEAGRER